jgi:hypothetical protein
MNKNNKKLFKSALLPSIPNGKPPKNRRLRVAVLWDYSTVRPESLQVQRPVLQPPRPAENGGDPMQFSTFGGNTDVLLLNYPILFKDGKLLTPPHSPSRFDSAMTGENYGPLY